MEKGDSHAFLSSFGQTPEILPLPPPPLVAVPPAGTWTLESRSQLVNRILRSGFIPWCPFKALSKDESWGEILES